MPGKNKASVLLGQELRRARLAAGLSQETLAFEAKLDRTYISYLENGHKSPTVDVLIRISQAIGVSASSLLGHVEQGLGIRRK
jgi:transcriptional regulator with XRE-family HTH domain